MKIFIDTANVDEIKRVSTWGILEGVTTNPSLIAKEGRDVKEVVEEICSIVDGPISAEVISLKCNDIIREAKQLSKIHKNIVIKVPMCEEGLKATTLLSGEGIKINMTLIFSVQQALLASKAGATYVSPFAGRLDDIGTDGVGVIKNIVQIFNNYEIDTKVIAASIRNPMHVLNVAKAGAHIATIPYKVLMQMLNHPLTDKGIEKFLQDYNK